MSKPEEESVETAVVDLDSVSLPGPEGPILAGVSLRLRAGESLGLLVADAPRARQLLGMLLGHVAPTAGAVRVLGADPTGQRDAMRRRVGYVPAIPDAPWPHRVKDYFTFLALHYDTFDEDLAEDACEAWSISPRDKIARMVPGQVLLTQLAGALATEPRLLAVDLVDGASRTLLRLDAVVPFLRDYCAGGGALLALGETADSLESSCEQLRTLLEGRIDAA